MRSFSEETLQLGPWSTSKITVAATCGHRFKLQYLQKKKPIKSRDPRFQVDNRGRIGNAAHKAIELSLRGSPPMNVNEALTRAAISEKLTSVEVEALLEFKPHIFAFPKRIEKFKANHPIADMGVELKFGLTKDLEATKFFGSDVFYRGVFDLVLALDSQTVIIIDHKTGEPKKGSDGNILPLDPMQLKSYTVAVSRLFPMINNAPFKGAQTAIHYVQTGDISWGEWDSKEKIEEEHVPWLIKEMNRIAGKVDLNTSKKSWMCDFCQYRQLCPLFNPELITDGKKGEREEIQPQADLEGT